MTANYNTGNTRQIIGYNKDKYFEAKINTTSILL